MAEAKDIILVTGATGNIGTVLVHLLASDIGQPLVRAATRDVNSPSARLIQAMNPATVQPVYFNEKDLAGLKAAFEGVTKMAIIAPFVPDMADWHHRVVEAAKAAETCKYVVKVSVTGARSPDNDPPPGRIPLSHWQGEEAIRQSGLASTMIRPTIFMQHFLSNRGLFNRGENYFYLPTGAAKTAFVDCRDIAAFAAKLLLAPAAERQSYDGQAYELTGPAGVTAAEIAEILSAVAERKIEHVDGEAAFIAHCQELKVPDTIRAVYAEAAGGWFSKVERDVFGQLTGKLPTSFAKFAYDHQYYF